MVLSHIRRSFPCPKELPVCAGHFLKVRPIPPGVLKPVHNSGFIFLLQGCQILVTNFKCKEKFSGLSNFKPSFRGWFQVITHWKASGIHYFLSLFPHLPWSIWIHPYSSLASFLERWFGLGQSHSEWEEGWDGPSAQANPDTRARLINITHTDKQEAPFSGKLNIQQLGNYRLPTTFEVQHTSGS